MAPQPQNGSSKSTDPKAKKKKDKRKSETTKKTKKPPPNKKTPPLPPLHDKEMLERHAEARERSLDFHRKKTSTLDAKTVEGILRKVLSRMQRKIKTFVERLETEKGAPHKLLMDFLTAYSKKMRDTKQPHDARRLAFDAYYSAAAELRHAYRKHQKLQIERRTDEENAEVLAMEAEEEINHEAEEIPDSGHSFQSTASRPQQPNGDQTRPQPPQNGRILQNGNSSHASYASSGRGRERTQPAWMAEEQRMTTATSVANGSDASHAGMKRRADSHNNGNANSDSANSKKQRTHESSENTTNVTLSSNDNSPSSNHLAAAGATNTSNPAPPSKDRPSDPLTNTAKAAASQNTASNAETLGNANKSAGASTTAPATHSWSSSNAAGSSGWGKRPMAPPPPSRRQSQSGMSRRASATPPNSRRAGNQEPWNPDHHPARRHEISRSSSRDRHNDRSGSDRSESQERVERSHYHELSRGTYRESTGYRSTSDLDRAHYRRDSQSNRDYHNERDVGDWDRRSSSWSPELNRATRHVMDSRGPQNPIFDGRGDRDTQTTGSNRHDSRSSPPGKCSKKDTFCKYMKSNGYCRFGDTCNFAHSDAEIQQAHELQRREQAGGPISPEHDGCTSRTHSTWDDLKHVPMADFFQMLRTTLKQGEFDDVGHALVNRDGVFRENLPRRKTEFENFVHWRLRSAESRRLAGEFWHRLTQIHATELSRSLRPTDNAQERRDSAQRPATGVTRTSSLPNTGRERRDSSERPVTTAARASSLTGTGKQRGWDDAERPVASSAQTNSLPDNGKERRHSFERHEPSSTRMNPLPDTGKRTRDDIPSSETRRRTATNSMDTTDRASFWKENYKSLREPASLIAKLDLIPDPIHQRFSGYHIDHFRNGRPSFSLKYRPCAKVSVEEFQSVCQRLAKWEPFWNLEWVSDMGKTCQLVSPPHKLVQAATRLDISLLDATAKSLAESVSCWGSSVSKISHGDVRFLLMALPLSPNMKKRADTHLWPKGTFAMLTNRDDGTSKSLPLAQRKQQNHDQNEWKDSCEVFDLTPHMPATLKNVCVNIVCHETAPYFFVGGFFRKTGDRELQEKILLNDHQRLTRQEATEKAVGLTNTKMLCLDEGVEEDVGRMIFRLTDSATLKTMEHPVRGKHCAHFQCFDLYPFLAFNKSSRGGRWRCGGGCFKYVAVEELEYCGLTAALIEEFKNKVSAQNDRIEFKSDKSYVLLDERPNRHGKTGKDGASPKVKKQENRPKPKPPQKPSSKEPEIIILD